DETGITVMDRDSSFTALIDMFISSGSFERYFCDRNLQLSVKAKTLKTVLETQSKGDIVTLRYIDESDELNVYLNRGITWSLKLMDVDYDIITIGDFVYNVKFSIESSEFKTLCTNLLKCGERMLLELGSEDHKVSFNAEGSELV
ncbi:13803_t:CDS:1, partial [Dentiscutata heterogama]